MQLKRKHLAVLILAGLTLVWVVKTLGAKGTNEAATNTSSSLLESSGPAFGILDTFNRADSLSALGSSSPGHEWKAIEGTWGIESGRAKLISKQADKRALAVVDWGATAGSLSLTFPEIRQGCGLIVRYINRFDYYMMAPLPSVGSWGLTHVSLEGGAESLGNLGQAPVGPGTTLRVDIEGDVITASVNGKAASSFELPQGQEVSTFTGLVCGGKNSDAFEARFDDLTGLPTVPAATADKASNLLPKNTTSADLAPLGSEGP